HRPVWPVVGSQVVARGDMLTLTLPVTDPDRTNLPVSWYPLEGPAADVVDGNNPSAVNALSFVPGKVGNGVQFGAGSFIDIPHSANLANQRFTLEAWARPDGPGPNNDQFGSTIVEKGIAGGSQVSAKLGWSRQGTPFWFGFGNFPAETVFSSGTFAPGQFHHVAGTYDGTTFRLFVDGTPQGQLTLTKPVTYDASIPWTIGSTS